MLNISWEDLPLPLDLLHKLDNCLLVLADIATSRAFLENTSIELINVVVNISAADVPTVFLLEHIHLAVGKPAGKDAELRVPKVNKEDVSGVSGMELILPEHSIIKGNGGWLIEQPGNIELCNFGSIIDCFSLLLCEISRDGQDGRFVLEVILLENELELVEVSCEHLLRVY